MNFLERVEMYMEVFELSEDDASREALMDCDAWEGDEDGYQSNASICQSM